MAITCEEKILVLSTKLPFSQKNKHLIEEVLPQKINWDLLISLSASCGILPILAQNLLQIKSALIPRPILEESSKNYQMECALHHLLLWSEFQKIIKFSRQKQIPIIPIKGIILAEMLYNNPGLRKTTDIDILLKKEHLSEIESILVNLGYTLEPYQAKIRDVIINTESHLRFQKENPQGELIMVEVHWDILSAVNRINNLVNDFWNNAVLRNISSDEVLTLSYEDLLFESLIELYKDITGHLGEALFLLKRHLDISQLLQLYGSKINWDTFIKRTALYGLQGLVYYALTLNKELLNDDILPPEILYKLRPSLFKRMLIAKIPNRIDLSNSFSLRKLLVSLLIAEVVLLPNRWKVLFLRLFYRSFPELPTVKKSKRINYFICIILNLLWHLLKKPFKKSNLHTN